MIVVLSGVRGSGKDTIGDILRDQHGFVKEAFANPLKEMVKYAFPAFTYDDLHGPSKNRERSYKQYPLTSCPWCGGKIVLDKYDNRGGGFKLLSDNVVRRQCADNHEHDWLPEFISPRLALQSLGTNWGRRLYDQVWIDACFERIRDPYEIDGKPRDYVITDGRFLNEIRRSRELGGLAVKLTRGMADSADLHPSEAELRAIPDSEFDMIFDNALVGLAALPEMVSKLHTRLKEKM